MPTTPAAAPSTLDVPVVSWCAANRGAAKSRRTRRTLLLAAAGQIARHGYDGASLRRMLDAAELTKGALYFHFRSKEELARAVVAEMFGSWAELVDDVRGRGLDPLWTLLLETDAVVARRMHDPIVRGGGRIIAESGLFEQLRSDWARDWIADTTASLQRAVDAGLMRPQARPGHLARTLVALMTGHFYLAESTPDAGDYRQRMTDMWEGVLPIVAVESWVAAWEASVWSSRPVPGTECFAEARRP